MARIALISCTSNKKAYKCPARELYSESPRFRLAYAFAKRQPLSAEELERVKWLARFGNDSFRNNTGHRSRVLKKSGMISEIDKYMD